MLCRSEWAGGRWARPCPTLRRLGGQSPPYGELAMSATNLSRRRFLAQSTAAVLAAPAILRAQDTNSRLNLAFIGSGRRGGSNLDEMTKPGNAVQVNVVALCDVNAQNLDAAARKFP